MNKISVLTLFLVSFFCSNYLTAQENQYNIIKFGIKANGGITDTNQLNSIRDYWFERVVEESNAELTGDLMSFPYNIEYGYQPFLIVRPFNFLQIGIKIDFTYSKLAAKFQNPLSKQEFELNIKTKSYLPGVFTYLTLGKYEIGGGIFHSYTNIHLNDGFFGYKDTWYSEGNGYELGLGYSSTKEKHIGFTMGIKYRNLNIDDFKDSFNREVIYSGSQENLSLKMSGFIIEMGLYFQFVKNNKEKNEN